MDLRAKMIRRLDEEVVQRIAAGEILQRPVNALKEMLENAIDAGATQITVTLQEGGLRLLQIIDNGHGIMKDDFQLLCERYATSKLNRFEDLWSMRTFGFRGEALSSISQVSRLTCISRRAEEDLGWQGEYREGRLQGELRPCASQPGTTFIIRDLFYNLPLRREALRTNEEQLRCIEMVQRYALQFAGRISLQMRRAQDKVDVNLPAGVSRKEAAKLLFAREDLTPFTVSHTLVNGEGLLSPIHAHRQTSPCFILFINGRLVEQGRLRRVIQQEYGRVLPRGNYGWTFLSLLLDPAHIDVNVHPTKEEVVMLHEESVVEACLIAVRKAMNTESMNLTAPTPTPVFTSPSSPAAPKTLAVTPIRKPHQLLHSSPSTQTLHQVTKRPRVETSNLQLDSVREMLTEWRATGDAHLTEAMRQSIFVGMLDQTRVLLQWETRLLMVEWLPLIREMVAQRILHQFGQFKPTERHEVAIPTCLLSHSEMLTEYFGIRLETSAIWLPSVIPNSTFEINLLLEHFEKGVNWSEERECFEGVISAICSSLIFTPSQEWLGSVWHPAIRDPKIFYSCTEACSQLATTHQLYRVFERC